MFQDLSQSAYCLAVCLCICCHQLYKIFLWWCLNEALIYEYSRMPLGDILLLAFICILEQKYLVLLQILGYLISGSWPQYQFLVWVPCCGDWLWNHCRAQAALRVLSSSSTFHLVVINRHETWGWVKISYS